MPLRTTTPIPIDTSPTSLASPPISLIEHSLAAAFAAGSDLGVVRKRQLRPNWCWASCVDMVLDFFGQPETRQCDIVGKKLSKPCCTDPFRSEYDVTCDERDMVRVWDKVGVKSRAHLGHSTHDTGWLKPEKLKEELSNNRPVQLGLKWDGTGGHAIIVRGWKNSSQGLFFLVNDPLNWSVSDDVPIVSGRGQVHYEELRQAYGMGKWRWTWSELEILED